MLYTNVKSYRFGQKKMLNHIDICT